jgi:hypothetical protein
MSDETDVLTSALDVLSGKLAAAEAEAQKHLKKAERLRITMEEIRGLIPSSGGDPPTTQAPSPPVGRPPPPNIEDGPPKRRRRRSAGRRSRTLDAVERLLRERGRPLHLDQITERLAAQGLGNPDPKVFRSSLARSLDRKVKNEEVFTKPEEATYWLRGVPHAQGDLIGQGPA